ncbi:hypothetical protein [Methanopyrus kandleri]|uniref:hypothetical protein n=1 Tax=Methanopyrus kandleri TaxID=2320 RepID=UPI0011E51565|nr:hypothetical protein [Methanopyrus kandleri]
MGLTVLGLVTTGYHAGNTPTRIRAWYAGNDRVYVAVVDARTGDALPGATVRMYVREDGRWRVVTEEV